MGRYPDWFTKKRIFDPAFWSNLETSNRALGTGAFCDEYDFSDVTVNVVNVYNLEVWTMVVTIPSFRLHTMPRRLFKGKGKRKASPSPSLSASDVQDSDDDSHSVRKRSCLSSPARVRQAALVKVKAKSSSSAKGLAGFAALVNNTNLSAARAETSRGLRSGSSSSMFCGSTKSREAKMVSLSVQSTCDPMTLCIRRTMIRRPL
jgi:hypothetical protein